LLVEAVLGEYFASERVNGLVSGFQDGRMWKNVSVKMVKCENGIPGFDQGLF
jgi:hypothetical protein